MVLATTSLVGWLLLPSFLHLPDGYSPRTVRDFPRYAAPVRYRMMAAFEVPGGSLLGNASATLRFDGEDRTIDRSGNALRLRLEWRF